MNIVSVCDDKYAQHLGIMLTSLFENTVRNDIDIYIIENNISHENKDKLRQTVKKYRAGIYFLQANLNKYQSFGLRKNMTHTVYLKLSIPDLLPKNLKKIIFLDCDLIVKEDISQLWNVSIDHFILAAVPAPYYSKNKVMGLPSDTLHFNSGVMVINLPLWKSENISQQSYDYLMANSHKIALHDQDAFNAILYNKPWYKLSQRWNQRSSLFSNHTANEGISRNERIDAIKNPAIIHFNDESKPWHYLCLHPHQYEYERYCRKSFWKDFVPAEKEKIDQRKLVVFGTGQAAKLVSEKIKDLNLNISYYIDNDRKKWNIDKGIYSPAVLNKEKKDQIYILIASMYYEEIKKQLETAKFIEFEHFISGIGRR
ncbi:glycosyltransferase family 8 protein [Amphibacillus sp. Q70]|uniref:glycosyltransferase family 8 protein n=1 Tax=Amphibacillus sp. Q70 TaxID=3453416 RepID=UPI003F848403